MEMTPDTFPGIFDFKGPFMLGFISTSILFGCCLISFVHYLQYSHSSDGKGTRVLVFLIAFVACATMIFVLLNTVREFAVDYGKFPTLASARWANGIYILEITAHVLVTGYFGIRAWRLYGRPLYIAIPLVLSMTATSTGAIGAMIMGMTTPIELRTTLGSVFNYLWLACQMFTDIAVTTLIIAKLKSSKTGWRSTDSLIHKLIVIGIECQLPPTLTAIAFLVVYLTAPQGYIALFLGFTMLYILCLYAALNSRHQLSARGSNEMSDWNDTTSRRSMPTTSINVFTETFTHTQAADPIDAQRSARVRGGGRREDVDDSTESFQDDDTKDLNTSEIRLV